MKNALKITIAGLCLAFNSACTSTPGTHATTGNDNPNEIAQVRTTPAMLMQTQTADTLRFYNLHTEERIAIPHHHGDSLTSAANWFMRDHRQAEPANLDPRLMDLLADLQDAIEAKYPHLEGKIEYHVISAYRSGETNEDLREAGGAQAKQSLHTHGQAMDIRVPGLSTEQLRDVATDLKRGGVGYYPDDRFVHVDIGRVRYW